MSIIVEHERRREEILEKALDVFADEGFENTTFQKIAERCAVTRTTLYLYYRNKKEVFNSSIKHLMRSIEDTLSKVRSAPNLSCAEKLTEVLSLIIEQLEGRRRLLSIILDYLLLTARKGNDPALRVRKRTIRLRHILTSMVIDGIRSGELKKARVRDINDILYGLLEQTVFRLVVLKKPCAAEMKRLVRLTVARL